MRVLRFLSKTRLDPAISAKRYEPSPNDMSRHVRRSALLTSVTLRIIGISLMLSSLSSEEAGMSGPNLIYFAFGLMLWSEGMLPRSKDGT